MNLRQWWKLYAEIAKDFSFDTAKDYRSSVLLSSIVGNDGSHETLLSLKGTDVTVIGNSPSLPSLLDETPDGIVMVADSAADLYSRMAGTPEYIVSDLDGPMEVIRELVSRGSILIAHAHGDNMNAIGELRSFSVSKLIGTTQNMPLWNVFNYGGFTDGDRAAFIADAYGAASITLVGFDFEHPNPKKDSDQAIKLKKLHWARDLLTILARKRGKELVPGDVIRI